jgi:UDP-2-acetamido-3-amino-2,3-dideoxy-glucuronate N-acetyltransferase
MMVGNPARRIGWISKNGEKLDFDITGKAFCKLEGVEYRLEGDKVIGLF